MIDSLPLSLFDKIANNLIIKDIIVLSYLCKLIKNNCHNIKIDRLVQFKNFKQLRMYNNYWNNIKIIIRLGFLPNNRYLYLFNNVHTLNLTNTHPLCNRCGECIIPSQFNDIQGKLKNIHKKQFFLKKINTLHIYDIHDINIDIINTVHMYPACVYRLRNYVDKVFKYGELIKYDV
jgi:hypothetical protein